MEEYDSLVKRLIHCINNSGLDYAFTGALAVSFYGSPRTTSDVDVMFSVRGVGNNRSKIIEALLCAGLKVEERRVDDALTSGYNIASFEDEASPYRVDVIFSHEKLDKRPGSVAGLNTFIQTPEGLISAKLRMIKATLSKQHSTKDEEDIRSILRFTLVDLGAIREKAREDKTLDILEYLLS